MSPLSARTDLSACLAQSGLAPPSRARHYPHLHTIHGRPSQVPTYVTTDLYGYAAKSTIAMYDCVRMDVIPSSVIYEYATRIGEPPARPGLSTYGGEYGGNVAVSTAVYQVHPDPKGS